MSDILRLVPDDVGGNIVFDADKILEANKGKFSELVLVGYDLAGEIAICSTHSPERAFWILEKSRATLLGMG